MDVMVAEFNQAKQELNDSFDGSKKYDNNFQKHFDFDGKLGALIPCIYTGGMFFGLFLSYKSYAARARLGRLIWP